MQHHRMGRAGHLENFAADMVGALALVEHPQEHAQQLRVLYVRSHHQTCALYNLQDTTVHLNAWACLLTG